MRVHVDESVCQGHTLCSMAAPGLFKLREVDGHAYVEAQVLTAEQEVLARKAASTCPEGAIVIDAE
jgi:ferredoxin